MEDKKLFLLDAYALIYRAYYALMRSPRITSDGRNTSAVFGFCNTLDDILRKENPPYMAVCFDPAHGKTFRHEEYPEYKAGRDKQPEDITEAIPIIKEILHAYGIRVVEVERYEADDVIGTLSVAAESDGFMTYMMTLDKDYGQLVTDRVFVYRPALKGKDFEIRGPQQICERYGVSSPAQVIDLLALEGDKSDNVPGCPGIGEVTAQKLIKEFGSVETLLANTDRVQGANRAKIEANVEQIRFSKHLVTIKTDVPLDVTPEDLRRGEPDVNRLVEIFTDLEFRTFIARLRAEAAVNAEVAMPAAPSGPVQGSLFDESPAVEPVPEPSNRVTVVHGDSPAAVSDYAGRTLGEVDKIAVSVYAVGDEAMTAELRGIAVTADAMEVMYIPLTAAMAPDFAEALTPLFNTPGVTVVSHDVKRDMILMRRIGVGWTAPYYDTAVAHYLLKPESKHTLEDVALTVLMTALPESTMTLAERRRPIAGTADEVAGRVAERAAVVWRLVEPLSKEITATGFDKLLGDIEFPFVRVLADMEWTGVRIDTAELAAMSGRLTGRLEDIGRQCHEMAGTDFNIGSPSQVGEVLFEKMNIDPKAKKTKTGAWSTTEEILEGYRTASPLVGLILEWRGLKKLLATYIDALPKLINPRTGKIHTTFNQTVTATGRISSTNPNLQNIPIRTDEGREIRRAFIADPGDLIVSADYSQIELRLMADMSRDPAMVEAFIKGEDIHRATAAKIYRVPIEEVTDDQRRHAKTANFGIIYGISAFGLSQRLGIPRGQAKNLIDGYLATYPGVAKYMNDAIERARSDGYVTTVMGRRRYLPEINSRNAVVRGYAERNAINAPLQGSAADIIKVAMVDIAREIERRGMRSRMIIQVHDELVFNVVPDELDALTELVSRLMAGAYRSVVPLEVSVGKGQNWLEAH